MPKTVAQHVRQHAPDGFGRTPGRHGRRPVHGFFVALLAAATAGCFPAPCCPPDAGVVLDDALVSSMEARVSSGEVRLVLHITNHAPAPVRLDFPSAQRYDFLVRDPGGAVIWSWSADRSFAQVLGSETVPPGESVRFEEVWDPRGRSGTFEAVGTITATNLQISETITFVVPS